MSQFNNKWLNNFFKGETNIRFASVLLLAYAGYLFDFLMVNSLSSFGKNLFSLSLVLTVHTSAQMEQPYYAPVKLFCPRPHAFFPFLIINIKREPEEVSTNIFTPLRPI